MKAKTVKARKIVSKKVRTNTKRGAVKRTKPLKRRRRTRYVEVVQMDQLYKIINKVQLDRKPCSISIPDSSVCPVAENILKDLGIKYTKDAGETTTIYNLIPSDEPIVRDIEVEELEDEMIEQGQLF